MKSDDEKNIHEGHRQRLLDLAISAGVDNMSEVQVMELFLTYIFPRGDVNPLAHRLLDKFETFAQVIDADINDLMSVKGINERSAKKISMFNELFYHFTATRMGRKVKVSCIADLIDMVEDHLRFRTTENMLLLALSANSIVTYKRRINMHSSTMVGFPVLELTNFIATSKAASLVIAHCHPFGRAMPSKADDVAFETVKNLCNTCGVNLIDSYIVGDDGVYSQDANRIIRWYSDIEGLDKAIFSK